MILDVVFHGASCDQLTFDVDTELIQDKVVLGLAGVFIQGDRPEKLRIILTTRQADNLVDQLADVLRPGRLEAIAGRLLGSDADPVALTPQGESALDAHSGLSS